MIKTYFVTLISFFVIDMIWLVLIARKFYRNQLGDLMRVSPNWWAALLFYSIFIFGLVYFVVQPALDTGTWQTALRNGLLFGLVTYATYDLTNLATLNSWPLLMTGVDLLWGTFLGGSVSLLSYYILNKVWT